MVAILGLTIGSLARDERDLLDDDATARPNLVLVPRVAGRATGVVVGIVLLASTLLGVVALQTHMAQQQMRLDRLQSDIARARRHFDVLRAERAELKSPTHLMARAHEFGLVPGVGVKVVEIPATVAAEVAATVGKVDEDVASSVESPLDEFGRLKPAVVGGP